MSRGKTKIQLAQQIFCIVTLMLVTVNANADLPISRQSELLHLLKHDCGSCHGMTMQGGLGPSLQPQFIAGKPKEFLVNTILQGRQGTPMPPWRQFISEQEANWMVDVLLKEDSHVR
ncbi:c-type cytochrome [Pseudomonadota bacterium]